MSLLRSLYYHPFHKNIICPRAIIYNTCPQVLVDCVIPGVFLYELWSILNEMATIYKNSIGRIWGKRDWRGGVTVVTIGSLLELSISTHLSPFRGLYDHFFHKNRIYPQGISYNLLPGSRKRGM